MSTAMRIIWLVALMFFTLGCSGYKVTCKIESDVAGEDDQDAGEFCDLESGDKIRINLVDGEKVKGVIQSVSSHDLILVPDSKHDQPLKFSSSEIISIEEEKSYLVYKIIGVVLLATAIIVGFKSAENLGSWQSGS